MEKAQKPLGARAYGHIGHLPSSRLGHGDHHVHEGQAAICTRKPRKGDRIIVQEKLDGACMSVANVDGFIVPLTRAGYHARDASYEHLRLFNDYVSEREDQFSKLLALGERICGEWLALAHGTRYDPEWPFFAPFIVFDIFRDGKRILYDEFHARTAASGLRRPCTLFDGPEPVPVADAMMFLGHEIAGHWHGCHGALDPVEGAIWRIEREGRVDFLAKYVRQDKVDGKYLPEISGGEPIWHWPPIMSANDNNPQCQREAA